MKKFVLFVPVLFIAFAGLFLWHSPHKKAVKQDMMSLPGGEEEENHELREEWERMRFADPNTGEIPAGISYWERQFAAGLPQRVSERSGPDWQSRGPWNVGGRTRTIAIDVTNENRMLAGGVSGGVWLSEDGGQSWSRKTPLNAHPGVVSIAQDTRPGHTNTWYYLSGEVYGTSAGATGAFYLGDGMFKSIDGGNTWTPLTATAVGNPQSFSTLYQSGWRVVTSPTDSLDVLYMATIGTVYRSTNGGQNWTAVRGGNINSYSYFADVTITSTGVLYATLSDDGPQKGIWRSTNGTTWTNITPANFPSAYDRVVMGINPNNENEVYFLGTTPGFGLYNNYIDSDNWTSLWRYNYLSDNGSGAGGTWTDLSLNLPSSGGEFDKFANQGGYDLTVKVQPGTNHVFVGGTNLYRSKDGFTSPNNTKHIGGYKPATTLPFFQLYPNHHPDQHDMVFLPSNPEVLITASDGGLHRTDASNGDSVVWTPLNRGYQTTQFYTAIIEHTIAGDNTIIGGLQDNGNFAVNSADPIAPWRQTVNGDGAFGAILDGKIGYVLSIQQGRVAKVAMDNNNVVTAFRRIDPIGPKKDDYLFINPLAVDPNDQNILFLPAGHRLYRQNDLANIALTGQWDSISQGWMQYLDTLPTDVFADNAFTAIAISQANPVHRVYAGTNHSKLFRIDNAQTDTAKLTSIPAPISNTAAYITCIAIDPVDADRIIVAYSNYGIYSLFLSENAGQTWAKVAGNLESSLGGGGSGPSLRWLSILPFADGTRKYFCGTSTGLYSADTLIVHASNSPGTQWALEGAGIIGNSVVDYIDVRPVDGLVVAATHGIGMFSANFAPASGAQEPTRTPSVRVWPNPARDVVNFEVQNVGNESIKIRLFNGRGQIIRESDSRQVPLSGLPVGVYYYEMVGGGWKQSGKVVKME